MIKELPEGLQLLASYYLAGQRDSARAVGHRLLLLRPLANRIGTVAFVFARSGRRGEAATLLAQLEAMPATTWSLNAGLVLAYTGLGDTTRAIEALERAAAGGGEQLQAFWQLLDHSLPRSARVVKALQRYHVDTANVHLAPASPR